jgi:hypothetical protein
MNIKFTLGIFSALFIGSLCADELDTGFQQPPASAKPQTWWHWMNGNITKEGITADLEAMSRVGLGGVQLFDVSDFIPRGPVDYMSPAWRGMVKHAFTEADRLGLEICIHNCPGWSASGGPWIKPEKAMQKIVFSEMKIKGPATFDGKLKQPKTELGFYRDIAILAFPTPQGELSGPGYRIADWRQKSGTYLRPKELKRSSGNTLPPHPDDAIDPERIVNLTGLKTWQVPAGEWTILRLGHTPTGEMNRQPPDKGRGLECDKLSRDVATFQWNQTMAKVLADAGSLKGKSFNQVLIDSYEVLQQNWTPLLAEQFRKLRGYELLSYLPCITGRVVGDLDRSERFLWDFRRTLADLFVSEYVGTFQEFCHQNGLQLAIEPYGNGIFNHLELAALADIPIGEFWVGENLYEWTAKLTASSANAHGRKFVGAEAFTSPPSDAWSAYPANMKEKGDYFFSQGINRFYFHTFAHQPWKDVLPGMTMGPHGMQNNRNNTWFEMGAAWMTYVARSQYLLQAGRSVKDLCYMIEDNSPIGDGVPELNPAPPAGHDYDFVDGATVMQMSVKDGQLMLPSGMSYRVLILLESQSMRPALAKKMAELIQAGAHVVGSRPTRSPSLDQFPQADADVKRLAATIPTQTLEQTLAKIPLSPDALFSTANVHYLHRRDGDTDIYFVSSQNKTLTTFEASFRVQGRRPELWNPATGKTQPAALYRSDADRTIVPLELEPAGSVFVVFRQPATTDAAIAFTRDGEPASVTQLHHQGDELIVTASEAGRYTAKTAQGKTLTANVSAVAAPQKIAGPWTTQFAPGWGAPEQMEWPELISWTQHSLPDVKHFSGTATYQNTFQVSAAAIGDQSSTITLDLGRVEVMAEVWLNGKNLGVVWKAPYQVDVTSALKPGVNQLKIRVVNLWINRLIGDSALPAEEPFSKMGPRGAGIQKIPDWLLQGQPRPEGQRKSFSPWQHFTPDTPLADSGLLGPVQLLFSRNVSLKAD